MEPRSFARLTLAALVVALALATGFIVAGASSLGPAPGPRGEYFAGTGFDGSPMLTERHGALTTEALRARAAAIGTTPFKARWTGTLVVDRPGRHVFELTSDDGGWLYVDGRRLIDNGGSHAMRTVDAATDLTAGRHEIRIEYAQDGGDLGLEVSVTTPAGVRRPLGLALDSEKTIWGFALRPDTALAVVSALWSVVVVLLLVAWPLAWFWRELSQEASRAQAVGLVAIVLAVTALAGFGLGWGLPAHRAWAPDELIPTDVLRGIDRRFSGGWSDLYPPAHFLLLALVDAPIVVGSRLGWFELSDALPYASLYLLSRAVSAVMASVTAAALALTCRWLGYSWRAATMATIVAVSTPIFVYYGRVANVDMPYVMWFAVALAAYAAILARGSSTARYAWLGAAAALSVGTKDQGYAFFPAIALHLLWRAWRATNGPVSRRLPRTLGDRYLWTGLAAFVVVFALAHNLVFNRDGFLTHVNTVLGPQSSGYRMFDRSPAGQVGLLRSALVQLPWCLGWLSLAAAAWGGAIAARRRDWTTIAVVALPIVSWYVCLIAVIGYHYDRFFLGVTLGLSLLAGVGLEAVLTRLRPRAAALSVVAAVLALAVLTGASVPVMMHADSRYPAERWLAEHGAAARTIGYTGRLEYLPRLDPGKMLEIPATVEDLTWLAPDLLVTNWNYSVRSRRDPNDPAGWRLYQALEDGSIGYRRVLQIRASPWTLLGTIDRLTFGGRLASEELTPFTNLNKIVPEIRIYARVDR